MNTSLKPHTNLLNTTLPKYQYAEPKPKTLTQYQPTECKPNAYHTTNLLNRIPKHYHSTKMLGDAVITNDPDITE